MLRFLPLCSLVAACGAGLAAYHPEARDGLGEESSDVPDHPVGIERIDPNYGPVEGGNPVQIIGHGFEGNVEVYFGRSSATFERLGPGRLVATAPDAGQAMTVDVSVVSGLGTATRERAYAYGADGPLPDTDNPPTGSGTPSPTGRTAGIVQISRLQVACPSCFGVSQSLFIDGIAAFHAPASGSWIGWYPPSGSCATNPTRSGLGGAFSVNGEWAYLQSGSSNVALRRTETDRGPVYENVNIATSDYLSNASYRLSVPDSGALGAPFEIANAVQTPQGFDSIQPESMLYTDPSFAFDAPFSRSGASVRWSPSGGTGTFLVVLEVYDDWTGSYIGEIVCHGPDNGIMNIPSSNLGSFPLYSLLAIGVHRVRVENGLHPGTGDTIEGIGRSGVLGTGYISF